MPLRVLHARLGALPVLLALLFALPACDSGGEVDPPSDDQVFFGVNYTRLFAPATATEIQNVRDDWAARNTASSNETVVGSTETSVGTAYLVEHTVTATGGGSITHYGVVHVPTGGSDLPALVIHHGGDGGFSVAGSGANGTITGFATTFPELAGSAVLVVPSYRSEPVITLGTSLPATVTSGGDASPWDYDVDDSIAFLDAALALFPDETDDTRIAAIGFSRGGNTAALHAIRDNRIDALVDYYGPTDFYNDSIQGLTTLLLTGNQGALGLPGSRYLLDNVLNPLRNADGSVNESADYASARLEAVRRSASLFESDLPDTQVHHHVNDPVVPIGFSEAFAAAAEGGGGGSFEFFAYTTAAAGASFHSPEGIPTSIPVASAFLQAQLGIGSATRPFVASF